MPCSPIVAAPRGPRVATRAHVALHTYNAHAAWSGKLQACARLLDAISLGCPEDKVVVVGDRLNVLQRIREYVAETFDDGAQTVLTLSGDVDMGSRKAAIDRYRAALTTADRCDERSGCPD